MFKFFNDLKITMEDYVLHFDFHAINMDNVDIVLGYPWMKSVGTININAKKKFLKLWYKKTKITLQDISLSKLGKPKGVSDAVSTGNLEVIPIDTSNDESMVTYTTKEYTTEDVHQTTEEAPTKPQVSKVKKDAPPVKISSYHHPHYPMRKISFRKEGGNQHLYGPRWQQI